MTALNLLALGENHILGQNPASSAPRSSAELPLPNTLRPVTEPYLDTDGRIIQLWRNGNAYLGVLEDQSGSKVIPATSIFNPLNSTEPGDALLRRLEKSSIRRWDLAYDPRTRKLSVWPHLIAAGKDLFDVVKNVTDHVFRKETGGHFPTDTPEARETLRRAAADPASYRGTDRNGNMVYLQRTGQGQVWVKVRAGGPNAGAIQDGGINPSHVPATFNQRTRELVAWPGRFTDLSPKTAWSNQTKEWTRDPAVLPDNERVQRQGIGRAGRQGQPGSSRLILLHSEALLYPLLLALRDVRVEALSAARRTRTLIEMVNHRYLSLFVQQFQAWTVAVNDQFLETIVRPHPDAYQKKEEIQTCIQQEWAEKFYTLLDQVLYSAKKKYKQDTEKMVAYYAEEVEKLYESKKKDWERFLLSPRESLLNGTGPSCLLQR
jgi:hypothetical protein